MNEKEHSLFRKIHIATNTKKNLGVNYHYFKKINDIKKTETKTFPKKTIVKSNLVRPLKNPQPSLINLSSFQSVQSDSHST